MNKYKCKIFNMNSKKFVSRMIIFFAFLLFWSLVPSLHAEILYFNDFNDNTTGRYTASNLLADWNTSFSNIVYHMGVNEGRVHIVDGAEAYEGKSLRITSLKGKIGAANGSACWQMNHTSYDELYVSFWFKFNNNIDFVKGGKIPGFAGGGTAAEGRFRDPDGTNGWSARIAWRDNGDIIQYVYHPNQPGKYADNMFWNKGGQKYIKPGTWHHMETHIKMNTPGQNDGIIQSWFDGELALDRQNMRFRDVDTFAIDQLLFMHFWGGGDSSYAPVKDEYAYFDKVTISTEQIGTGTGNLTSLSPPNSLRVIQ